MSIKPNITGIPDAELIIGIRAIRAPRKGRDGYEVSNYYVDELVDRLERYATDSLATRLTIRRVIDGDMQCPCHDCKMTLLEALLR